MQFSGSKLMQGDNQGEKGFYLQFRDRRSDHRRILAELKTLPIMYKLAGTIITFWLLLTPALLFLPRNGILQRKKTTSVFIQGRKQTALSNPSAARRKFWLIRKKSEHFSAILRIQTGEVMMSMILKSYILKKANISGTILFMMCPGLSPIATFWQMSVFHGIHSVVCRRFFSTIAWHGS